MLKIFLVRHGETEHNRDNIVSGVSDSKLTEKGKEQAKRLAKALENEKIDAIYSSPLVRSLKTAQEIASKQGIKVITNKQLTEINFGILEGKSWDLVHKQIPNWKNIRHKFKPENGETQEDVSKRVSLFLEEIKRKYKDHNIVVVGHGSVNKAILGNLLNIDIKGSYSFVQMNGCINVIGLKDEKIRIYKLNDISHLEDI